MASSFERLFVSAGERHPSKPRLRWRRCPSENNPHPILERLLFICECARLDCIEQIELSRAACVSVRRDPRRFFVVPTDDHAVLEAEDVVERHDRYWVVEKTGVAAEVPAATG